MSNGDINQGRRRFLTTATSVVGAAGVVGAAVPFVGSWQPSAKAKAAGAPVKVNIGSLEPGAMSVEEWRGKPVYIVRRTPEILANLKKIDNKLRDPQSLESTQPDYVKGEERSIKPEILVLLAVCTHLGCAPQFAPDAGAHGEDWIGGFFCPCHGSKFDLAGRVFKGVPAPKNLEVPPYAYLSDDVIIIGMSEEEAQAQGVTA